jgi:Tfp pilus assembly protein FimT
VLIKGNQFAITLIEILVVITILAILASVIGPNLRDWNCKQKVRNDFDGLNGVLETLRLKAGNMNRKMKASILINDDENYVIQASMGAVGSGRSCDDGTWEDINSLNYVFDEGTTVVVAPNPNSSTCFYPDGEATSRSYTVSKQCVFQDMFEGDEDVIQRNHQYRNTIIGTTGFIIKEKENFITEEIDWEEM